MLATINLWILPAALLILASAAVTLLFLTRVWRPFGRRSVMVGLVARPFFGRPEAVAAIGCAMAAALAALTMPAPGTRQAAATPGALEVALPAIVYYTICVGCAVLCAVQRRKSVRQTFFNSTRHWQAALTGLGLGLVLLPLALALSTASFHICEILGFDTTPQEAFGLLQNADATRATRITLVLVAVVAAPVAEEFVFRGLLFPALCGKSAALIRPLLLQGLFFGAIHVHLPTFLPLSLVGVCFGLGYAATGTLLTPIIMHITFNAASLLLFMAAQ